MNKFLINQHGMHYITKSNKPEKIEAALANHIQKSDEYFFKSIHPFTVERQRLQSKIPKVTLPYIMQNLYYIMLSQLSLLAVVIVT